jgi:hypothetical protein
MRTSMIVLIVAACAVTTACNKRSSLYIDPGRLADAPASPKSSPAKSPPRAPAPGDAVAANP